MSNLTDYELAERGRFDEIEKRYANRNCDQCIYWQHTGSLFDHDIGICVVYGGLQFRVGGCPSVYEDRFERRFD